MVAALQWQQQICSRMHQKLPRICSMICMLAGPGIWMNMVLICKSLTRMTLSLRVSLNPKARTAMRPRVPCNSQTGLALSRRVPCNPQTCLAFSRQVTLNTCLALSRQVHVTDSRAPARLHHTHTWWMADQTNATQIQLQHQLPCIPVTTWICRTNTTDP